MPELAREEYYPWYRGSSANFPKDRYLNVDFLQSEQERIEEASRWNQEYRSARNGQKLDEYITYIIPVDVSELIKEELDEREVHVTGTSAIRNCKQLQKLALFPEDVDLPPDYSLVRLLEPRKNSVHYVGEVYGVDAIFVEDYERLPQEYIYYDLPTKEMKIYNLLEDHLGGDKLMAQSVYSPMISSPPTINGTGGIGSCSLTPTTRYADTLNKQVARMLPPEYTDYGPPARDVRGYKEPEAKGRGKKIVYRTAEKIPDSEKRVGLEKGNSYSTVQKQVERRAIRPGEYSYLGNIAPSGDRELDVAQDTLKNFTQNEITISSYLELKRADVDLSRLESSITDPEDLWINVVDARQVMPSINKQEIDREGLIDDLKNDWRVFLPQMGFEESPDKLSEIKAEETLDNVLRIAQKIARSEKRERVSEEDIKYARRSFNDQAERLLNTDLVKDATRAIERSHTSDRESIIHHFLQSKPCTMEELLTNLLDTRHFDDRDSTKEFIQRMADRGYIMKSPDGKLRSV